MTDEGVSPPERLAATAASLRIDAATAEVVRAFSAADVQCRVLKGPAIARWLYPADQPRGYVDSDLLVRPGDAEKAEAVLARLGFERGFDDRALPDWWREHGSEWWRPLDGVLVDLHRSLPGIGVAAEAAWAVLTEEGDSVVVAGYAAPTLGPAARAMHIALHAAHHGVVWGKVLADLERALAELEESLWRDAAALATRLEATDAFSTGLRLTPAGEALAIRLALPRSRSVEANLRATTPPPVALGFEQLARAETFAARMRIVARKLFPPAAFIRHWSPRAAESRRQLALAYLRRPFWLLRSAPRGFRAWRAARRRADDDG